MRRLHLFEFNDSAFCPRFIRDSVVEVLGRAIAGGEIPRLAAPMFADFVHRAGIRRVLDLGSGTGLTTAAIVAAAREIGFDDLPEVVLSDLRGCREARAVEEICNGHCSFWPDPVDAMEVDPAIDHQARTIFCLFHHFRPEEARRIIAAAVGEGKAIMIMEPFRRHPLYLRPLFFSSFSAYLANPFRTRRDRFFKFVFTYMIPVLPFLGLWDGLVSTMRIHEEEELMAVAREVGPGYHWEFHRIPFGRFAELTFFIGVRKNLDTTESLTPAVT